MNFSNNATRFIYSPKIVLFMNIDYLIIKKQGIAF